MPRAGARADEYCPATWPRSTRNSKMTYLHLKVEFNASSTTHCKVWIQCCVHAAVRRGNLALGAAAGGGGWLWVHGHAHGALLSPRGAQLCRCACGVACTYVPHRLATCATHAEPHVAGSRPEHQAPHIQHGASLCRPGRCEQPHPGDPAHARVNRRAIVRAAGGQDNSSGRQLRLASNMLVCAMWAGI